MSTPAPSPDFALPELLQQVAQFTDRLEQNTQNPESTKYRELFRRIVIDLRLAKSKADELFPEVGKQLQQVAE